MLPVLFSVCVRALFFGRSAYCSQNGNVEIVKIVFSKCQKPNQELSSHEKTSTKYDSTT